MDKVADDRTRVLRGVNFLGGGMMKSEFGELLFLGGTSRPIPVKFWLSRVLCLHDPAIIRVSTGGGIMSTDYKLHYCRSCGHIEEAERE